jgi:hypothetical protein
MGHKWLRNRVQASSGVPHLWWRVLWRCGMRLRRRSVCWRRFYCSRRGGSRLRRLGRRLCSGMSRGRRIQQLVDLFPVDCRRREYGWCWRRGMLCGVGGGGRGRGGWWWCDGRRWCDLWCSSLWDGSTLDHGTLPAIDDLDYWRAHSSGVGSTAGMRHLLLVCVLLGRESRGDGARKRRRGKVGWSRGSGEVAGRWCPRLEDGESGKADGGHGG